MPLPFPRGRVLLPLVIALGMTLLAVAASFLLPPYLLRQYESQGYPTVSGTIIASGIDSHTDNDGVTSYKPRIAFVYQVAERNYRQDRYFDYRAFRPGSTVYAREIVERYPEGVMVTVYYNPARPEDAVLEAGVSATDLISILNLLGMQWVAATGAWVHLVSTVSTQFSRACAGGATFEERGASLRVHLPRWKASSVAFATALFILSVGPALIFLANDEPSLWSVGAEGSVLALAVAVIYRIASVRSRSGVSDLTIDGQAQTVRLPGTFGHKNCAPIPMDAIVGCRVEEVRRFLLTRLYEPRLVSRGPSDEVKDACLVRWVDRQRAENLCAWLNEKLQPSGCLPSVGDGERS